MIADWLRITFSYSRGPWWGPYDVWQDSQTATFPGGGDAGDRNRTDLTAAQILARTGGRPSGESTSAECSCSTTERSSWLTMLAMKSNA